MPPKSKRQKQLQEATLKAREGIKRARIEEPHLESTSSAVNPAPTEPTERSSDSESGTTPDPTYDPQEDLSADANISLERFVEDWVLTSDRNDKISLSLFLCYHLQHLLNFTHTKAAEYAGIMLGKSDRTIHQWHHDLSRVEKSPKASRESTNILVFFGHPRS